MALKFTAAWLRVAFLPAHGLSALQQDEENCSLPEGPLFVRGDDGYYVDPETDMLLPPCAVGKGGMLSRSEVSVLYPCKSCRVEVGWVLRTMLGSCGPLRITCWEDLLPLERAAQALRLQAFLQPSRWTRPVAAINSRLYDEAVELLLAHRVELSEVVLVHLGDEQISNAIWGGRGPADWVAEYARWHHTFRNHWLDDPAKGWPFQSAADEGRLDYFPLGLPRQFYGRGSSEASRTRTSQRKTFFSFSGGLALRESHLLSIKRAVGGRLHIRHPPRSGAPHGYRSKDDDHIDLLMASALCLMVPAASIETNRFYESLEAGCLPVFVARQGVRGALYDSDMARFVLFPLDRVTGQPPAYLRAWSAVQLPSLLNRTVEDPAAMDARQADLRSWWPKAQHHFRQRFEVKVCPGS
eukprot:TRINITY_DN99688_c0_g1_i1.p1 TRINITY_DN99688_c0_g1~~TRINITY_DN99688_c0_g1_i1.p1  ORF type:complete len:411 (+),score=54.24 TRINITY_DN99688_c0_g1_i1:20-1252(+)